MKNACKDIQPSGVGGHPARVAPGWGCCICSAFNSKLKACCRECGHIRCGPQHIDQQIADNLAGARRVLSSIESIQADTDRLAKSTRKKLDRI